MGPDIFVPFVMFTFLGAVIVLPRYFKSREREAMQATLRTAIEKGQPLPAEVIDAISRDAKPLPSAARDIRTGLIWLAVAAGLAVMSWMLGTNYNSEDAFYPVLGIAAIPAFVAIAFFASAALNRGKGRS